MVVGALWRGIKGTYNTGKAGAGLAARGGGWAMQKAGIQNHYDWFFYLTILFHIYDAFTRFQQTWLRFTFYFLFWVLCFFIVFRDQYTLGLNGETLRVFFKSGFIAAFAFFFPFLLNLDAIINVIGFRGVDIILGIMPIYFFYFFFVEPDLVTERTQSVQRIYIYFLIGVLFVFIWNMGSSYALNESFAVLSQIPGVPDLQGPAFADTFGVWGDIFQLYWEFFKDLGGFIWTPFKSVKGFINSTLNPQYYSGQTDTKAETQLGVRLEKLQSTDKIFLVGEPVGIFATLKANTLDKPIDATISCKAKSGNEEDKEDYDIVVDPENIYPQADFSFDEYSQEEIDCTFPRTAFNRGTHKVKMFVDFEFETQAYLKTYYVDRERSRALRNDKKNVLDVYKITDKNPKATYTDGPLLLGMSIGKTPPVELDLKNPERNRLTLGISLRNRWEGKINKIKKLAIMMPNALSINSKRCGNIEFLDGSCADMKLTCNAKAYRVYIMDPDFARSYFKDIDQYKTIRCPISINPGALLVSGTPLITEFFRINTEYHYQLEKSASINVREVPADE